MPTGTVSRFNDDKSFGFVIRCGDSRTANFN
jgi:cold shock CspA family protein